ncbi:hypothetical protein SDC9_109878 [bioreactor metagenome]|uniref:Uncharacterized protein n=1 Tax=bioreactor metagenome TaxID=1076179 RepID=A0A645BC15_9ZZZZ
MRFELVNRDVKAGFGGLDHRVDDAARDDLTHAHADELEDADLHAGSAGGNPEPERHEAEEDYEENKSKSDN